MKKISKMDALIKEETRRRKTTFWGQPCYIKPVIHPDIFGDGLQLCYLGTINQRPHYWLIRVDSNLDLDVDYFDFEKHLLEPLEDYFGRYPEQGFITGKEFRQMRKKGLLSDYENYKDYMSDCKYPRLDWSGGHWGTIKNFKNSL